MTSVLFVEYPRCSTCRKAKAWLGANGIAYVDRHIVEEPPTADELAGWLALSGLPFRRFFNTSGQVYRELNVKAQLDAGMEQDEALALLSTNGMLVKRPIVVAGDRVLVGFKEAAWEEALLGLTAESDGVDAAPCPDLGPAPCPDPAPAMPHVAQSIVDLIGKTPLLQLNRYGSAHGLSATLLAKLEYANPAGSAKDRIACAMIAQAERDGLLSPGGTIIEPTSGNTGIGLAACGARLGYRVVIVLPDSMSAERRALIRQYGAELVLTPAAEGMAGSIAKAEELHATTPNSFIPQQFDNPANPAAHEATTAEEIWRDTAGAVDAIVAGVGTGGTLCGTARGLKAHKPEVLAVAVQPAESPVLTGGEAGPHGIQGIMGGFVPGNYDAEVVDEVVSVTTDEALAAARELARTEGINVGISSGAALAAATQLAARPELVGKVVVTILPDTGERYLSTELFA